MMLISFVVVAGNLPGAGYVNGTAAAQPDEFRVSVGERQLFLDDHGIVGISNLRRTMHQPAKRGAVIRSPQPTKTIQTRTAPVWDEKAELYKIWVITVDDNLWQSRDGLHWTPGPATNMRVMLAACDPLDRDPARRFKAPLLNRGFAVSPDGVEWKQLGLPGVKSSDEGNFSFDAERSLFIHTVKRGGVHGRAVALATSSDFETWQDFGLVFQADDEDQERGRKHIADRLADPTLQQTLFNDPEVYNVDVYNMGVFRYEGLYIGMPAMYHAVGPVPNYPNTDGFHLIQLACSRDLKDWQRLGDRKTFIGPSRIESGAYDLTQILPPSAPVVRDDELWFYYTGLKWRSSFKYIGTYPNGTYESIPGRDRDGGAVCLAVLRRDGFVSLDAGEEQGHVVSKRFAWSGDKLLINADARDGEVLVEILDLQDEVVANSVYSKGDTTRGELQWKPDELTGLQDRAVAVRFTLRNAKLYSWWIE
ncbi:MAG: hypothetical protein ABGZ35_07690 [Planctomycetaceae bacterium]|jgi:hypothetical protein